MSAARTRRVLLIAIAASLLVHLLFAGYFRWKLADRLSDQSQTFKVQEIRISRVLHTPPPTPPPTPAPTPVVRSSIAPPKLQSHSAQGPPAPHVAGPASAPPPAPTTPPTPAPISTRAGACVSANADPTVEATPGMTEIPAAVRASKTSGTAAIQVSLDPLAHVTAAAVTQSTGNPGLDSVALALARDATYTPKYSACKPVAGTYTFTVKFVAW